MTKFDFKSGDLIEWVYVYNEEHVGSPVVKNEEIYSTIKRKWVPVGSRLIHMCISYDDDTLSWLNEKGLFYASANDLFHKFGRYYPASVIPRVRR